MSARTTRGRAAGVRPSVMARRFASFEKVVRAKAQRIAYEWGDIDNCVVSEVDEFLRGLYVLEERVQEAIELLKQPQDSE